MPQGLSDKRKGELFLKEKAARKYFEAETIIQKSKVDSLVQLLGAYKVSLNGYKGLKEEHAEQLKDSQSLTDQERSDKEECQDKLEVSIKNEEKANNRKKVYKTLAIVGGVVVAIETAVIAFLVLL